ncbi:DUF6382 domain-containing protein [Cohnella abietis]|uniref:FHA domain-containing protein n=1 Tax=Cohnella abietis TaxID=2507935 RepID=A0A3T1D1W5_9BACL|nr:DUF6382 domain-containing protein [Cohnella abietis]BBI32074.1 hypothetical protein KCTCHS21_14730 [Cohnella abietis]
MIIERNPPVTREEINETQLLMLKKCEIPGLLPLETEEYDGQTSLRYSLAGTRMLSEAMRASNWSMSEMLGALCRLAEVLEECRLYLLDADRIRLHDEFIFVGEDWHDLRFTYIPIDMPTLHQADDLERLIIRWMMKVKEPDGQVMQNVLRMVATPGFMPIVLSRYIRQILSGSSVDVSEAPIRSSQSPVFELPEESKADAVKSSRSWDFLHPISADLHSVSEMWGDFPEPQRRQENNEEITGSDMEQKTEPMDLGKWRIIVACASLFLVAMTWRFLYLNESSEQKLLLCLCVTLVSGAGVLVLWNGVPAWAKRKRKSPEHSNLERYRNRNRSEPEPISRVEHQSIDNEHRGASRFSIHNSLQSMEPLGREPTPFDLAVDNGGSFPKETSWITAANDQTTFLEQRNVPNLEVFYLVWKTKNEGSRIPLKGSSLVIGRSADAAQHVDQTMGISRAHVELVKVSEQWKVKDLGSRNGSRLNDTPMAPYELYSLQIGDCITLANSQYQFQQAN